MEALEKLNLLGQGAQLEIASTAINKPKPSGRSVALPGSAALCSAKDSGPNRATRLLRVLQTNRCDRGCAYCPLRAQNDTVRRATFQPDELAKLYLQFDSRHMVDGLFLSSGSDGSPDAAMEQMVKTAAILREKYRYGGYIHLKVLPGAALSLVEEAARLSDRLSINLEAPSADHLDLISDEKSSFQDIIMRMEWIARLREERGWLRAGQSTQLVVGAGRETDREILQTSQWLYKDMGLNRVYYGAFSPAAGTPLEGQAPAAPGRQQRLYQSDWLLTAYGFTFEELPFTAAGGLPHGLDPKVAYALLRPERFPVEINQAEYEDLLRVPGIGPISARRIVSLRRQFPFKTLEALKQVGAALTRARDFVTIDGRYFGLPSDLLFKAGKQALAAPAPSGRIATQLTLPLEWSAETILPPRLTTNIADLAFD